MAILTPRPSEPGCRFALDKNCHMPKKGYQVCQSCWSTADGHQKEMLKDFVEGYCSIVGCWQWASGDVSVCNDHNAYSMSNYSETKKWVVQIQESKQELRIKAERQDQHESQSSEPSRKLQKSADGGASAARITATLQHLSTPELQILSENCIRELASRAGCSVLA